MGIDIESRDRELKQIFVLLLTKDTHTHTQSRRTGHAQRKYIVE